MGDRPVAIIGAGVIGASWTALFLAAGRRCAVHDPAEGFADRVKAYVERAWPVLTELGLTERGNPGALTFHDDPAEAVDGAEFVQESAPERLAVKRELFARIEGALAEDAVLSSSTSGFTLSEMQSAWSDPAPLVLGHPFNPPHLIPLVEVMGNERTRPGAVEAAEAIYRDAGKVTIRVRKEVPGHVANRLQAALWREVVSLVQDGVVSVGDADRAISAGPGLRWAVYGPSQIWNLAAGPGGMQSYLDHFADSFNGWWQNMGEPFFDEKTIEMMVEGVKDEVGGRSMDEMAAYRDRVIVAAIKAMREG